MVDTELIEVIAIVFVKTPVDVLVSVVWYVDEMVGGIVVMDKMVVRNGLAIFGVKDMVKNDEDGSLENIVNDIKVINGIYYKVEGEVSIAAKGITIRIGVQNRSSIEVITVIDYIGIGIRFLIGLKKVLVLDSIVPDELNLGIFHIV